MRERSRVGRRLDRLAAQYQVRGCATCRAWDQTTVELVPANVTPLAVDRPERCPDCGRRAPERTALVQIIMPDDDSAGVLG